MSIVFILLFPTGGFIAAFYKQIFDDKWFQVCSSGDVVTNPIQ